MSAVPGRAWTARRDLLRALIARELKSRHKGSHLGFLWSLLSPLLMCSAYAFFFHVLAGRGSPVESILIGIFAWQFTATCVTNGLFSILGNASLVKKVAFPREILPVATTSAALFDYLMTLVVQTVLVTLLLLRKGLAPEWTILLLPLPLLLHVVLNFSLALIFGACNVLARDLQHLTGPLLTVLFFLTPAMYDYDFVLRFATHPGIAEMILLNPLAALFTVYRALVLPNAVLPDTPLLWIGLALPLLLLPLAWRIFGRLKKDFADHI